MSVTKITTLTLRPVMNDETKAFASVTEWTLERPGHPDAGGYTATPADACMNAARVLSCCADSALHETIADLGAFWGNLPQKKRQKLFGEDSRESISLLITWAKEFEALNSNPSEDWDYMEAVEIFWANKLKTL